MAHVTQPPSPAPDSPRGPRPADVDTGFWLWVLAVPLLSVGYIVGVATGENRSGLLIGISSIFLVVLIALVVTFLFLMRSGYRWARTVLTAGGLASIVSVVTDLFAAERPTVAAVVFAITGIVGVVLVAGGIYQLHRKDSQEFFTR